MEYIWLVSVATLVAGAVVGFLFGRSSIGNRRQAELSKQAESAKNELEDYKSNVSAHFEKTAELVGNLTQSYKDVHQHLAGGAQELCDPGSINLKLEPALQPKLEEEVASATEETPVEEHAETTPPEVSAEETQNASETEEKSAATTSDGEKTIEVASDESKSIDPVVKGEIEPSEEEMPKEEVTKKEALKEESSAKV
ncbi:MAG: DUF1043 family protein [Pseudomonadota bacterium]